MRRGLAVICGCLLLLAPAGCGGTEADAGDQGGGASGGESSGEVVDRQPAGQAIVTVDGREYSLEESPVADCAITPETITAAFWAGDNSVTFGAGANLYDDGWAGALDLGVAEPDGEDGPIRYFVDVSAHGDRIVIEGDSMSYAGPMDKYPPNDGTNPPPIEVEGTISLTCG